MFGGKRMIQPQYYCGEKIVNIEFPKEIEGLYLTSHLPEEPNVWTNEDSHLAEIVNEVKE